jgi:tellurite resistance protein
VSCLPSYEDLFSEQLEAKSWKNSESKVFKEEQLIEQVKRKKPMAQVIHDTGITQYNCGLQ